MPGEAADDVAAVAEIGLQAAAGEQLVDCRRRFQIALQGGRLQALQVGRIEQYLDAALAGEHGQRAIQRLGRNVELGGEGGMTAGAECGGEQRVK